MNKKFKYTSLVAAGAVTLGLVGGTLAWFTSSDSVTNKFSTLGGTNGAGIEIVETFDQVAANQVTPGSVVNKDVQVKNTEKYDQFIRVKLTPQFVKVVEEVVEGEVVKQTHVPYNEDKLEQLNIENEEIKLVFTSHLSQSLDNGNWVDGGDGYYYYIGKVGGESWTNILLDKVVLPSDVDRCYSGKLFEVVVEAQSVQASNNAVVATWFSEVSDAEEGQAPTTLQLLKDKYLSLQKAEANIGLADGLLPNNTHNHSVK